MLIIDPMLLIVLVIIVDGLPEGFKNGIICGFALLKRSYFVKRSNGLLQIIR